jgi:hypothetical protein
MKRTRSASFSSSSTTEACEMPAEASRVSDFTISGNARGFGRFTARPRGKIAKLGDAMRWKLRSFLVRALSRPSIRPRELQPV